MSDDDSRQQELPLGVLTVRPGRGANCSSVGSVVDMLFVAGALGGALVVAVSAALEAAMAASPGDGDDKGPTARRMTPGDARSDLAQKAEHDEEPR